MPAPGRLMWSRRKASSRAEAAEQAASAFKPGLAAGPMGAACTLPTILRRLADLPEPFIKARVL